MHKAAFHGLFSATVQRVSQGLGKQQLQQPWIYLPNVPQLTLWVLHLLLVSPQKKQSASNLWLIFGLSISLKNHLHILKFYTSRSPAQAPPGRAHVVPLPRHPGPPAPPPWTLRPCDAGGRWPASRRRARPKARTAPRRWPVNSQFCLEFHSEPVGRNPLCKNI